MATPTKFTGVVDGATSGAGRLERLTSLRLQPERFTTRPDTASKGALAAKVMSVVKENFILEEAIKVRWSKGLRKTGNVPWDVKKKTQRILYPSCPSLTRGAKSYFERSEADIATRQGWKWQTLPKQKCTQLTASHITCKLKDVYWCDFKSGGIGSPMRSTVLIVTVLRAYIHGEGTHKKE